MGFQRPQAFGGSRAKPRPCLLVGRETVPQLGRRRLIGAAIATTAGVTQASAQSQNTMRLALAARSVRTLDPLKSVQGADNWTHVHVFDTLVMSPDGTFATTPADF